jgi:hypothetical protein
MLRSFCPPSHLTILWFGAWWCRFAALASSSGRGSGVDSRLMEALDAARPPERSSSMPYSHSRERSQSHNVTHSLSVERRGKHQNIRQQPTDHLSAKRVSRIMANRLSAAKSRVKKLQHTADLEGRVKELQVPCPPRRFASSLSSATQLTKHACGGWH